MQLVRGKFVCHYLLMKHQSNLAKLALLLKLENKNLFLVGCISIISSSFSNLLKARLMEDELGFSFLFSGHLVMLKSPIIIQG